MLLVVCSLIKKMSPNMGHIIKRFQMCILIICQDENNIRTIALSKIVVNCQYLLAWREAETGNWYECYDQAQNIRLVHLDLCPSRTK